MSCTAIITPGRTSGVGPLAVYFDARSSSSTTTSNPFHDLHYDWSFGDPAGGDTWDNGAQPGVYSKNSDIGAIVTHVFETPSATAYTVTLNVWDGVNVGVATVDITVTDPATVYTQFHYYSTDGSFTGAPAADATHIRHTSSDLSGAVNTSLGTNRALYFQSGQTFSATAVCSLNDDGPWTIGSFGSGARPIVNCSNNDIFRIGASGQSFNDGRVMDLELNGQSNATCALFSGLTFQFDQLTVLRVYGHHMGYFALFNDGTLSPGQHIWNQIAFVDCAWDHVVGGQSHYGMYWTCEQFALLGSLCDNSGGGEHVIRMPYWQRGQIAHNTIQGTPGAKSNCTLRPPPWNSALGAIPANTYSEYVYVHDNKFIAGLNDWITDVGPQDDFSDERARHAIYDSNWFISSPTTQFCIIVSCYEEETIRNNLFNVSNGLAKGSIEVQDPGTAPWVTNKVRVYNNTAYSATNDQDFIFLSINAGSTNIEAHNNLGYAPSDSQHVMISGTTSSASNNSSTAAVLGTNPVWVSSTPGVDPAGFKLQTTSPYKNAGTTKPAYVDFFGVYRPQSSTWDIGFAEFDVGDIAPWEPASGDDTAISSAGVGVFTVVGAGAGSGAFSTTGTGTFIARGLGGASGDFSMAGAGDYQATGDSTAVTVVVPLYDLYLRSDVDKGEVSVSNNLRLRTESDKVPGAEGDFSMDGTGVMQMSGAMLLTGDFVSSGSSTFELTSESAASGDFSIDAAGDMQMVGDGGVTPVTPPDTTVPPISAGDGGTAGRNPWQQQKDKRRRIIDQEDEELVLLVNALAPMIYAGKLTGMKGGQ